MLAYVLMPNHFHLLILANENTEIELIQTSISKNVLSEGIRLLLSSYTKGVNKQQEKTGNLIQQNTKSKCVFDASIADGIAYVITCFHYIHENPVRAGFVDKIQDWHYSSYRDYAGLRNGTLCNQQLAKELLGIEVWDTTKNKIIDQESLKNIW